MCIRDRHAGPLLGRLGQIEETCVVQKRTLVEVALVAARKEARLFAADLEMCIRDRTIPPCGISDDRFIRLIWKFLKAGYVEDWTFHNTYSGMPQGGIVSPILANIYLDKLDRCV